MRHEGRELVASGFRGWWVLSVACLVVMLSNGMTLGGITVFDPVLLDRLQVGRGELKLRDLFQMLTAAFAAPWLGLLADRIGVRPMMLLGLFSLAAGFAGYPFVDSLVHVYALHVLLGFGLAATGLVLAVSVVSRWFVTRRGLALGLVLAGGSVGNALLPPFNSLLNGWLGWQGAFWVLACFPLVLVPAVVWIVRERPEDLRQRAYGDRGDGGSAVGAARATPRTSTGPSYAEALRTPAFRLLAVLAFTTFAALVGLTAHTFLILKDQGFADTQAALGLTVLFLMGLIGKLVSGVMSDRFGVKSTLVGYLLTMLAGAVLLATVVGTLPWLTLAVLGFGWGGIYTLQQVCAAAIFSGPALGRIVGTLVLVDSIGAALGPFTLGTVFDTYGSYGPAYLVILGALTLALGVAALLRIPEANRPRV